MPEVIIPINAEDNTGDAISSCTAGFSGLASGIADAMKGAAAPIMELIAALALLKEAIEGIRECLDVFREFDDQMVEVAKTTGASGEELNKLREDLMSLSSECPISAAGLAEIATAAGQLGIAQEDIAQFTEAIMQISVATEMSAEEAAASMGKLVAVFQMPVEDIDNLGSVINNLSDTTAASCDEIIDAMTRAASSAALLDVLPEDLAAISATLAAVSESGERAGTRLRDVFSTLASDADDLAQRLGMTGEAFRQMIEDDAVGALNQLLEYYSQIDSSVERNKQIQEDWGTTAGTAIMQLVEHYDELQTNMAGANSEMESGASLANQFATAMESWGAQVDTMMNGIENLKNQLGGMIAEGLQPVIDAITSNLIPAFQELMTVLEGMDFSAIGQSVGTLVVAFSDLVEACTPLAPLLEVMVGPIESLANGFAMLLEVIASVITALETLGEAAAAFVDALANGEGIIAAFAAAGKELGEGLDQIEEGWSELIQRMSEPLDTSGIDDLNSKATGLRSTLEEPFTVSVQLEGVEEFQNYVNEVKGLEGVKVTATVSTVLEDPESVNQFITSLQSISDQQVKVGVTVEGKEELEVLTAGINEIPELKITSIKPEVSESGEVESYKVMIESIPEAVTTSIHPEIQDVESLDNFITKINSMNGVTANVTLNTQITGANVNEFAESISQISKETNVKIKVDFDDFETYQQFKSDLEAMGANVTVTQVKAEVSGTGDIEHISAIIEDLPEEKEINTKVTMDKEDIFDVDNILAGIKREILINIGVAVTGEEDLEEVKNFIDGTPKERAFQLVCSIIGEEGMLKIGEKIKEFEEMPADIVKDILVQVTGDEDLSELHDEIDLVPQETIAQMIVDVTGMDELEDASDQLELMPSELQTSFSVGVEGEEDLENVQSTMVEIPPTQETEVQVNVEGTEDLEEVTEPEIPDQISVGIDFDYTPLEAEDLAPTDITVNVHTNVIEDEEIPSYQHGGYVPETGIYRLHKGERVVPTHSVNNNSTKNINIQMSPIINSGIDSSVLVRKLIRELAYI